MDLNVTTETPTGKRSWTQEDLEEDRQSSKPILFIYGDKGDGKTVVALGKSMLGDTVYSLSFDAMTGENIADPKLFSDSKLLHNWDVNKKLVKYPPEGWAQSAHDTFDFAHAVLDLIEKEHAGNVDWLLLDGWDGYKEICAMRAKHRYKIQYDKNVPEDNKAFWSVRNVLLDSVPSRMQQLANKGVLVTSYIYRAKKIVDGVVVATKELPSWAGKIMTHSQLKLLVDKRGFGDNRVYRVLVDSPKGVLNGMFQDGYWYNVTGMDNLKLFWEGNGVLYEDKTRPVPNISMS